MTNLIKAELYKLHRNKTFWVLIGTIAGVSVLLHYLIITDWWMMNNTVFDHAGLGELDALLTYTVPVFFNLIVSTLAGFFIAVEYSNSGVIKNQLISGNKRSHIYMAKYVVFSLGSILAAILIPLITAAATVLLFGRGDIFHASSLMYLGQAYGLFAWHFLGYTALIMLLATITEDSGKTIIISVLLTMVLFAVEKFSTFAFVTKLFEYSIFQQFSEVFKSSMTHGEVIKSVLIAAVTIIILIACGVFIFNKKEIK